MNKCNFCNKEFGRKPFLVRHLIWCSKKNDFFQKYGQIDLNEEYVKCGSVLEFIKQYPHWIGHSQYYKLFKEFGVDVSAKNAANNKMVKDKRYATSISKHGVHHNFCKNHPSRKNWEKRLLEDEGITNVFQRDDVKLKSLDTFIRKYGKERWLYSITARGNGVISKINKIVFDILLEENMHFDIEFKIKKDKPGSYYSYDILLNNNKIIEVNGDYWHGNPVLYRPTDILLKGSSAEMFVFEKWHQDYNKIKFAESNGYSVMVIWEYDLKNNFIETKNKILEYAKN